MTEQPPLNELGTSSLYSTNTSLGWSGFIDEAENTPELRFPTSSRTYDRMITDGQIKSIMNGLNLPLQSLQWQIDPNGADIEVARLVAEDLGGLPVLGDEHIPTSRRASRFNFEEFLRTALLSLRYGFMMFEQVAEIDEQGRVRLKKLAARPPRTIEDIKVDSDGSLVAIKQRGFFTLTGGKQTSGGTVEIPVDRLVAYVWEQEPGVWTGRSFLRCMYRNWLVKDRLIRVDALKHERNGMGVPVVTAPLDASDSTMRDLHALATKFKSGEASGAAIPNGSKLDLVGVSGTLPDTIASINYHNEEMARSALMMFLQLGTTSSGSRSLGDSFIDFFALATDAMATWFANITTRYVIQDLVDWNYGEDAPSPKLVYDKNELQLAGELFATFVEKQIISVDDNLEAWVRSRYGLPVQATPSERGVEPQTDVASPRSQASHRHVAAPRPKKKTLTSRVKNLFTNAAADDSGLKLPDRELRRQPTDVEVKAKTDYAKLEKDYENATDKIVGNLMKLRDTQIDELVEQIIDADGDIEKLAVIAASPLGADQIEKELVKLAEQSLKDAQAEAVAQGVKKPVAKLTDTTLGQLKDRADALVGIIARNLAESASRNAIQISTGVYTPTEVAIRIKDHLTTLSERFIRDYTGGEVVGAQNTGRFEVFAKAPEGSQFYATELLDANTCDDCEDVDGTEYATLEEGESDYPLSGGYVNCAGGPRCRGSLIVVYPDEAAPTIRDV